MPPVDYDTDAGDGSPLDHGSPTDPGGLDALEEGSTTEVDLLPAVALSDATEDDATLPDFRETMEPTAEERDKALQEWKLVSRGLEAARVNRQRRRELVEDAQSAGRSFVVYSGLGRPAMATVGPTGEAPTVLIERRRRRPWAMLAIAGAGVVVVAAILAASPFPFRVRAPQPIPLVSHVEASPQADRRVATTLTARVEEAPRVDQREARPAGALVRSATVPGRAAFPPTGEVGPNHPLIRIEKHATLAAPTPSSSLPHVDYFLNR
jgi:hypothetical protein